MIPLLSRNRTTSGSSGDGSTSARSSRSLAGQCLPVEWRDLDREMADRRLAIRRRLQPETGPALEAVPDATVGVAWSLGSTPVKRAVVRQRLVETRDAQHHMIDAARREQPLALDGQRRLDGGGDQTCGRLKQLQLETIRIRPHANGAGASGRCRQACGLQRAGERVTRVRPGEHAVMPDRRRPARGCADGDVTDLAIRGHVTEHDEVAQRIAHRLLMQLGPEDPRVELRRRGGVGHDDVEVLETEVVERQLERRGGLSPGAGAEQRGAQRGNERHACRHRV